MAILSAYLLRDVYATQADEIMPALCTSCKWRQQISCDLVQGAGWPRKRPYRMPMHAVLWARYDATTDRWRAAAPMVSLRFALGAAALDDCIYAVCSSSGAFAHSACLAY